MSCGETSNKLWVFITAATMILIGLYFIGPGSDSTKVFQPKPKAFSSDASDNVDIQTTKTANLETATAVQTSTLDPEDAWMMLKAQEMEERSLRVRRVCKEEDGRVNWERPPKTMLVDEVHKLAMCRHAKVGTSTLLGHFLSLVENLDNAKRQNIFEGGPPRLHASVPQFFKSGPQGKMEKMLKYLEDYTVFSFVRHPFERFVSAFVNKVVEKNYFNINDAVQGNFSAFADYVLHYEDIHHCKLSQECEFMDLHWRPFWARCGFCDIPYLIGHMETFQDDLFFIATIAGVADLMNVTQSDSIVLNRSKKGRVNSAATREHFQLLDKQQKKRLYEMFEFDFRLFGYDPEPYVMLEEVEIL